MHPITRVGRLEARNLVSPGAKRFIQRISAHLHGGVLAEPGPLPEERRSEHYALPAMTMTYNFTELKG